MRSSRRAAGILAVLYLLLALVLFGPRTAQEGRVQQKPPQPKLDGDIDPSPKLAIHFGDGKGVDPELNQKVDNWMRFGLVTINQKDPKNNGKKLLFGKHGASNSTLVSRDRRIRLFGNAA